MEQEYKIVQDRKAKRRAQSAEDKAFHQANRLHNIQIAWAWIGKHFLMNGNVRKPIERGKNYQVYRPPRQGSK